MEPIAIQRRIMLFLLLGIIVLGVTYCAHHNSFVYTTPIDSPAGPTTLSPDTQAWKLPIVVCYDKRLEPYEASLKGAVDYANAAIGCPVFQFSGNPCGLYIRRGLLGENTIANWNHEGRLMTIAHPGDVADTYITFLHELGHALGLNHDVDVPVGSTFVSVMSEHVVEHHGVERMASGLWLPMFEERDIAALRERYCKTSQVP